MPATAHPCGEGHAGDSPPLWERLPAAIRSPLGGPNRATQDAQSGEARSELARDGERFKRE